MKMVTMVVLMLMLLLLVLLFMLRLLLFKSAGHTDKVGIKLKTAPNMHHGLE